MIQPLAGEYAGRRTLLEAIPFFTGYAVEIGHLIDAAERSGLEGLGQVDLERRVHRNQELEGLSRMSFVILQAVMKRLEERRKARLFAELGSTMKLPRSGKGRLGLEVIELADQERPPMIRIPEYVERRKSLGLAEPPQPAELEPAVADLGGPLTVLIAPDSFKGSLTSVQVAQALADGWARARPDDQIQLAPLADGGEGTIVAIAAAGGWDVARGIRPRPDRPARHGPLAAIRRRAAGDRRAGRGLRAVAADRRRARPARGLDASARARSCWRPSTPGARAITLGIGGSATNDGGAGILRALGAAIDDGAGRVDLAGLDRRLAEVELRIACDVTNPLLGERGAAATYGPQKGATPGQVAELDRRLARYADALETAGAPANATRPVRAPRVGRVRPAGHRGPFPIA